MADTDEEIDMLDNFPEDYAEGYPQGFHTEYDSDSESEKRIHYDSEAHISRPFRVKDGTVPINILEFDYSFGYDCRKYFNLCVADTETIIFASGNIIHFFNVTTKEIWFRRGSTGGGIGHIIKNPKYPHIAIGENGIDPPISIYQWPTMQIVTLLFDGTQRQYSHLDYSPNGLLLASQGGAPDYSITIWDWKKSKIILRCKSYSQNVYNVKFSRYTAGHLVTAGVAHIKFWKMAKTFTGLKLKGDLGRFGKSEISDVVGVYQMADRKVLSSCESGNILLWEEGLIKFEISKKNKFLCHTMPITQFEYINAEIYSVGMDGFIRIWFYETIDQAEPTEEHNFLEVQPIFELCVSEDEEDPWKRGMLMCMQKKEAGNHASTLWYVQDGNGGIWLIDLDTAEIPTVREKILKCHGGAISDMAVAEWGPFVATLGVDARLHLYNYETKKLIVIHEFRDVGAQVLWLPTKIDQTGSLLICSFGSGVIRMVKVAVTTADQRNDTKNDYVKLVKVLKPHSKPITVMSFNPSQSLLITASEDATVFIFSIKRADTYPVVTPIGYVRTPSGVTCVTWKPGEISTLLVGCIEGDCAQFELPNLTTSPATITYELKDCKPLEFKFHSVKSAIRRKLFEDELQKKKDAKVEIKRAEMEKLKADNPGIEIDEEAFLMDSEESPPLPEIYIPEIPNKILFLRYTDENTIWLSMAGFDAGYVYEYPVPKAGMVIDPEPIRSTMIYDADDTEITTCLYHKNKYIFFAMEHGEIRVCRINRENPRDFSDYWMLSMHDNYNGFIPKMLLTCDRTMLLTCGHDGNLFSYKIQDDTPDEIINIVKIDPTIKLPDVKVEDIDEPNHPTLEDVIVKAEKDRLMAEAKKKKEKTLDKLRQLTGEFSKLIERNKQLPKSQQIPQEEFELDVRITTNLKEQLNAEMDLVRRKQAFKVEKSKLALQKLMDHFVEPLTSLPFAVCRILKPDTMVYSLRNRKLQADFHSTYEEVVKRIAQSKESTIKAEDKVGKEDLMEEETQKTKGIEVFLKSLNLPAVEHKLSVQVKQTLERYVSWKRRLEERQKEWTSMLAKRVDRNVTHPDDVAAMELARKTVGEYKLKDAPINLTGEHENATMSKYKEFLDCTKRLYDLRENFNVKLRAVRSKKQALQLEVKQLIQTLKEIHKEIPPKYAKPFPDIPMIDHEVEFPEENLKFEEYVPMAKMAEEAKRQRESVFLEVSEPVDEEYEVLMLGRGARMSRVTASASFVQILASTRERFAKVMSSGDRKVQPRRQSREEMENSWERELKEARVMRKIHEQDCILEHIQCSYEKTDAELDELEEERLYIAAESIYMELFLLTLHQEFIILRDYEAKEAHLRRNVDENLMEQVTSKQKIQASINKMERRKREISRLQETIKDIAYEYTSSVKDNKFQQFLTKIFKKKFKEPKQEDDSDTSSISSSSTSDEEDEGASVDSKDIGYVFLDESICPPGCDKELYNMAFVMREKRYEHERQIKEEQKIIESLNKDIELELKKSKFIEDTLKVNREKLTEFMLEKQQKLNDIDVTVILKFHQLQHFTDSENASTIQDSILFDKAKLSRLYARIEELQKETSDLYAKQRTNKVHLHRMKIDYKFMNEKIRSLKNEIKEEMIKKFGKEISLTDMYEGVLQRMIYDIKADLTEISKSYEEEIKRIKEQYSEELVVLENLIQENTEKLSFLTVLEEEQLTLRKILQQVPITEEEMLKVESQYEADLIKLENILTKQKQQKELFLADIKRLSMKSGTLPPICRKPELPKDFDKENDVNEIDKMLNAPEICEENNLTTLIRSLLMKIIEPSLDTEKEKELKDETIEQIISGFSNINNVKEAESTIEEAVKHVQTKLSITDAETKKVMHQAIKESLFDIIYRKFELDNERSDKDEDKQKKTIELFKAEKYENDTKD